MVSPPYDVPKGIDRPDASYTALVCTYVHTYVYVSCLVCSLFIYVCMKILWYVCLAQMYVCMHANNNIVMYTYVHQYILSRIHGDLFLYLYFGAFVYVHTYVGTYICMYVYYV